MHISIVGAGPVGLLLSILLSYKNHKVTIYEKRLEYKRDHALDINQETINIILDECPQLHEVVINWSNNPISTVEIQEILTQEAIKLGVTIINREIIDLNSIKDNIIIGADGAHSTVRRIIFDDEKTDVHDVQYMVQIKYHTSGNTRPRKMISAMAYSFLNGLSGDDMVLDFETLSGKTTELIKPGTLHIPVPRSVYNILSADNRGKYDTFWTLEELQNIQNSQIEKLCRIIRRYEISLSFRNGLLGNPKITVIPLSIYRSTNVVNVIDNKLYVLCGDSSSGLIYQLGLNKGLKEAVELSKLDLITYPEFCKSLYEKYRDEILMKHDKIVKGNRKISSVGVVLTSGLGLLSKFTSHSNQISY